ncbi:MAG: hypothetical protein MJ252_19620 [archaeon]|nr:hypothetical protein [archaeon]
MGNMTSGSSEEKESRSEGFQQPKPMPKKSSNSPKKAPKKETKSDSEQTGSNSRSNSDDDLGNKAISGSLGSTDDNIGSRERKNSYLNPIPSELQNAEKDLKEVTEFEYMNKKSFNEDDIIQQRSPTGIKGIERNLKKFFPKEFLSSSTNKTEQKKGNGETETNTDSTPKTETNSDSTPKTENTDNNPKTENTEEKAKAENIAKEGDYELTFYRNSEQIRRSYFQSLIVKKIIDVDNKPKKYNSLIIFDWDDTLLCTSFLSPGGVYDEDVKLSDRDWERIRKLEVNVLNLLKIAKEKGDVYIITNAGPGWVEFSAEKYYPSVFPLLKEVKIISARGQFEAQYPGESRKWKIFTFLGLQKELNSDLVTNIICLGDSVIELDAGKILASKFTQAYIKTIKFKESPKPEELNKQLILVAAQFNSINAAVKNLTIRVEKKRK